MSAFTAAAILTTLAVVAIMAYPNQKIAAENIRRAFLEKKLRYAILMSRCQAGKTGAYQELIRLMFKNGDIDHAYILCGSHDTDLYEQAVEDAMKANPNLFKVDENKKGPLYSRQIGESKVIFRQDFEGFKMNTTNALIIVDESHLDQTQNQQLDKFLKKHDLGMNGNLKKLNKNNTYIVSVSATPYSELACLTHNNNLNKHVESLIPGEGYFGLAEYKNNGLMKETFDIWSNRTKFANLINRFSGSPKWSLVRLIPGKKGKEQELSIKLICNAKGYNVIYYNSEHKQVAINRKQQEQQKKIGNDIPCLEDPPSVNTVVIIYGCLRAGKVVPKKHISFVWEGANTSKTDSLVQGLPGRMCGYKEMFGDSKPLIFMPPSALKSNEKSVLKASEIDRAIIEYPFMIPTKATNLKRPRVANVADNGKTQCVPLRLVIDGDDDDYSFTDKFETKYETGEGRSSIQNLCHKLLLNNLDLVKNSSNYSDKQKAEIIEKIVNAPFSKSAMRYFHGGRSLSHFAYFENVLEGYENNTSPTHHVSKHGPLNFLVTFRGSKAVGANHRYIYVIFYTDAGNDVKPGVLAVNLNARISHPNGKSIFENSDLLTDKPIVAGGVVGFDETNLENPLALETAIRDYLIMWKTSTLTVSRCIQSSNDRFTLSKKKFHWESSSKNDVKEIIKRLNVEFGIKLIDKYKRGSKTHFNLNTITW